MMNEYNKAILCKEVKDIVEELEVLTKMEAKLSNKLRLLKMWVDELEDKESNSVHSALKVAYLVEFIEEVEKVEAMWKVNTNYRCDWYFINKSREHCFILRDKFEKTFVKNLDDAIVLNTKLLKGLTYKNVNRNGKCIKCNVLTKREFDVVREYVELIRNSRGEQ